MPNSSFRGERTTYSTLKNQQDLSDAMHHHRPLEDGDTSDLKPTMMQRFRRFLGLRDRPAK